MLIESIWLDRGILFLILLNTLLLAMNDYSFMPMEVKYKAEYFSIGPGGLVLIVYTV